MSVRCVLARSQDSARLIRFPVQGVQEQLLTIDVPPLSANSAATTAAAAANATGLSVTATGLNMTTSRRRRGPAFLPAEHDDLPPQVAFQTLHGHKAPLTALDMSEPYGTLVTASADEDRSVRLWDLTYGEEIGRLEGHDGLVKCLQVESTLCITGGRDGRIKIWDLDRACAENDEGVPAGSASGSGARPAAHTTASSEQMAESGTEEAEALRGSMADPTSSALNGADSSESSCLRTLDAHTKDVTCLYFDGSCLVCLFPSTSSFHRSEPINNLLIYPFFTGHGIF